MYDSHTHTNNSLDSEQTIESLCESALEKGCDGIAVTDHADLGGRFEERADRTFGRVRNSIAQTREAQRRYAGRLEVFQGIELSEYPYAPSYGDRLLSLTDYDVTLGSVHFVELDDWTDFYSAIDFSEPVPEEKLNRFLEKYFTQVQQMADWGGFDVLTHLTCPLRYICGRYKRQIDVARFRPQIVRILETVVRKGISLEVNTSGLHSFYGDWMPDPSILRLYRELGGEYITLGSDAHAPERVMNGFGETVAMLRELGFTSYYYYRQRKPQRVALDASW